MNTKRILTGIAIAGGIYAVWRFIIKPQVVNKEAKKMVEDYQKFDTQRELIAQVLPQENQIIENENII